MRWPVSKGDVPQVTRQESQCIRQKGAAIIPSIGMAHRHDESDFTRPVVLAYLRPIDSGIGSVDQNRRH